MPPAAAEAALSAPPAGTGSVVRAFGLEITSALPLPGVLAAAEPAAGSGPTVRLEPATRRDLLAAWQPADPRRISNRRMANGRSAVTIDADDRAGHLMRALGFGAFWISPAADLVRCAPLRVPAWRWQRYLIGQVLPLVAVLRGLEVFHASAVVLRGRALAFIGMSTAGKTSVALNLVLRGARFLTDDVLAVSPASDGGVVVHPGVGLASLRHEAGERLEPGQLERLGRRVGRDADASRIALDCHPGPVPLRHAFVLDRTPEDGPLRIERLRPVDPRLLLGGSFNFVIRTPERLTNQLDLCARMAQRVVVSRASVPPSVGPAELAEAVDRYVEDAGA